MQKSKKKDSSAAKQKLDSSFKKLVAKMQTAKSKKAVDALFKASSSDLGKAAVKAAVKGRKFRFKTPPRAWAERMAKLEGDCPSIQAGDPRVFAAFVQAKKKRKAKEIPPKARKGNFFAKVWVEFGPDGRPVND